MIGGGFKKNMFILGVMMGNSFFSAEAFAHDPSGIGDVVDAGIVLAGLVAAIMGIIFFKGVPRFLPVRCHDSKIVKVILSVMFSVVIFSFVFIVLSVLGLSMTM